MTLHKRTKIFLWICAYVCWFFAAQWFLPRWRGREIAGWSELWFVPTMIAGVIVGLFALVAPNRLVLASFGLVSICHIAVGLGLFPR